MSDYNKIINRDAENINGENFFAGVSSENRELFKRALSEAMDSKMRKIEEEIKDIELPKMRMDRPSRERIDGALLEFSEEENL